VSATPARQLAHRILVELASRGPTLAEQLARPAVERLEPRERALLHELVLGSLRQRGRLDHALMPLVSRPLDQMDPATREALRLGAHQVLHLRVPDRAAVSESVSLLQGARGAGLVNAVLRRLCREGPRPAPDPVGDTAGWLRSEGSLPEWLASRWLTRLGADRAVARARALASPPETFFRYNPRCDSQALADEHGIHAESTAVPGCWRLTSGRLTELARAGKVYVQDIGSQLVAQLAAGPGRVLDACAAPGGKALLLSDATAGVVAVDASPRRLRQLTVIARGWGADLRCLVADARRPPFGRSFDAVLLDAPCTGLGTLARHPDIRWRLQPEDVARHAHRQRQLLDATADLVRSGGRLVYATCSLEPEETGDVVEPFLERNPGWTTQRPPDWASRFTDADGVRVVPERDGSDGFFATILRRQ
jgi:16S rRNA (cytosine967-C5)-methyltransferase